ncbi:proprotein convertase P-domain-containing protein, partial [Streptomyces sp. NPDC085614]|uniref:proprotein convertase P-domain-containing protein n=1 Tax=Streptomyces sp. NPDC085614 TaxID=3365733 RepID=UPI0037D87D4A
GTVDVAKALYGATSPEVTAVENAWAAINVGSRPGGGVNVTNPGPQSGTVGTATSLQIQASSAAGALRYAAASLPTGLSINATTGLISGTPTTAATLTTTITVTDAASRTGTTTFTWTIHPAGGGNVFENLTDVAIPDLGTATSPLTVIRSGSAPSALRVSVNIVHSWRGDLVIDLLAPDGTARRLKNSSPVDSADNVIATYTVNASTEAAAGTWRLRVQDVYARDIGYINSWRLTF